MKIFTAVIAIVLALSIGCRRQESSQPAQPAEVPDVQTNDLQRLESMIRRYAPVDLTADVAALPENERKALAKIVEAAKVFDALFLRQVWEGNETMALDLVQRSVASRAGSPALLPDQQGTVVAPRSQRAVHPGGAEEAGAGQLLSRGRHQGGGRGMGHLPPRRGATPCNGFLHDDPPGARRRVHARAL